MKKFIAFVILAVSFAACKSTSKKIIVLSKGTPTIDINAKTIVSSDGTGHTEKMFMTGAGDASYKLSTPAGESSVQINETGLYIVNAKTDTIIGSYQHYTDAAKAKSNAAMTQDDLKLRIDSLHLLLEGKNISTANRNFYILPNTAVKISDNIEAEVITPYHKMVSAERKDGKDPEIYRFYSIKEIREIVANLQVLATPKKQ